MFANSEKQYRVNQFKQQIDEFLKNYSRNDNVDFAKVISLIPDTNDFPVSKVLGENSVFCFLHSVTSHVLHQKRTS